MLAHTLLHLSVELRSGARRLVRITHVYVYERCAGVERLMRRFDLLGRRHRNGWTVLLARNCPCDSNGNNDRLRHAAMSFLFKSTRRSGVGAFPAPTEVSVAAIAAAAFFMAGKNPVAFFCGILGGGPGREAAAAILRR